MTLIHEFVRRDWLDYSIVYSEAPGHATALSEQAVKGGLDYVIAVGGDGTVNEVGAALSQTETALGILPTGSGNGLARHLGIPLKPLEALKRIRRGKLTQVDTGLVNGKPFFSTTGSGLDAAISQAFAEAPSRGFWSYVRVSLRQLMRHQPQLYEIELPDGQLIREKALLVTVANASQFGNNALIAPQAKSDDGLLDLCWMRPQGTFFYLFSALRLFRGTLDKSQSWEGHRISRAVVRRPAAGLIHIDGDPKQAVAELHYEVIPQSLSVII